MCDDVLYKPMLAEQGSERDLARKGYIFEPKLDGTRAICYLNNESITMINRRGRDITYRYPEFDFSGKVKAKTCVLDGEIIVYDADGNPDFNLLQGREQLDNKIMIELRSKENPATYVVFDILMKNGKDLTHLSLKDRKRILDRTILESKDGFNTIQKIFFTKNGRSLYRIIRKHKLEGVMAKDINSRYYQGERVPAWLKIKYVKTIDCIIVGYVQEKRIISSLALALYDNGKLRYVGRVGTGATEEFLERLYEKLEAIRVKKPYVEYSDSKDIKWVKPRFVCEIKYLNFTKKGKLRAPVFLRLRDDKPLRDCVIEA